MSTQDLASGHGSGSATPASGMRGKNLAQTADVGRVGVRVQGTAVPEVADLGEGHGTSGAAPDKNEWAGAACIGAYPDLWYPDDGDLTRAEQAEARAAAQAICNTCPIRTACLQHAIDTGEIHGIWGGIWMGGGERHLRRQLRGAA